jgi:peptidoglycan-associated lipoprotein
MLRNMGWALLSVLLLSVLLLAGCATPGTQQPGAAVEDRARAEPAGPGAEAGGIDGPGRFEGGPLDAPPGSPLAIRVIYFDFDRNDVRLEDRPVIEAHAAYLVGHPNVMVILEGHADERGSREYNLALGERRSVAVRELMAVLGVGHDQLQVVSFGEEKPAAEGHDEGAWQLNRRVELTYPRY